MEATRHIRARAARIVLLSTLVVLTVFVALAPAAGAQRHSARRADGDQWYSMSWSTTSFMPFARPTIAPGLREPSIDGTLIACQTGSAASWPDETGLDIRYKFRGGASGVWGGPGDQLRPAVSDGLIAGVDNGMVAVFDPASATDVTISDTDASYPLEVAFAGSLVVWGDHRNGDWDIYARRFDRDTGQPTGDVFPVCTAPGVQKNPAVAGDTILWQDSRTGGWDIYAYDLTDKREYAVCTAPGDQTNPDVDGDTAVWQDSRRGQWDIYACDLASMVESALCTVRAAQVRPAVSSDLIVWQDFRPRYEQVDDQQTRRYDTPQVYAYSLAADQALEQIAGGRAQGSRQTHPDASGSLVVWVDDASQTAPGTTHIAGARLHDLWAYNISLTPADWWVRSPVLTFAFHVEVCPMPPVAQVGFSTSDSPWDDMEWRPYASPQDLVLPGGDGRKLWLVSFRDSAGGTPGASGSGVILDTHGPSCYAPYTATARSSGYATLRYKVTDKLSPKARAGIAITRLDGSPVRTLPLRWVETGKLLERRVSCDLLPGVYLFAVTATDLAGNPQIRTGSNQLTVR